MFLTNFFFNTDIEINIRDQQVPYLMVYYGFVACALYFVLFLLYRRALGVKDRLELNDFEVFYTRSQKRRVRIMFSVPLISIVLTLIVNKYSFMWASLVGGSAYFLYPPLMLWWARRFKGRSREFDAPL